MLTQMTQRVENGDVERAVERGLRSPDARVALAAAGMVLDRAFGRPVALTEHQLPGTQAYTELRSTLGMLPPDERLAYLREQRMVADVALPTPTPPRALVRGDEEGQEAVDEGIDAPTSRAEDAPTGAHD